MSTCRTLVRSLVAFAGAVAFASSAHATFHTWRIEQVYSNADGTIQFVVLHEASGANGQEFWAGEQFTSTRSGVTKSLRFDRNLPSGATAGRRALLATKGFADLHLVAPDYEMAAGFLPVNGGTLSFAGVDFVNYASLPTDGVTAINRSGAPIPNVATNFAGQTGSVTLQAPPAAKNFQGLWWNPDESGWGINFTHQDNTIFAAWFTYDLQGKPWWLIAVLDKTGDGVYSGAILTLAGPPFNALPFPAYGSPGGATDTTVGTMKVTFAGAKRATIEYTVNGTSQSKAIVPQEFGPLPTCTWGAQPDLALATNYTDLWWRPDESGWGINFSHQGDIVFATWFTYDGQGKPWWLIAELHRTAGNVYAGAVLTVAGPPFNSVPWSASPIVDTEVGSATVTFIDGNAATFANTVNGMAQTKSITRQVFATPGTACK